jgi:transketolase
MGAGVAYSTLGGTHHAMEDIAVASALPNMRIIAPCDPYETREATKYCATQREGPVYLRLGKAGEPNYPTKEPWKFGQIRSLGIGGGGVAILTYGPIARKAFEIAGRHKSADVFSCHTLKPLDVNFLGRILTGYKNVMVVEEHVPYGGLSSRVKQLAWHMKATCSINTVTLDDKFIHTYGTHDDLLAAHGWAL